MEAGIERLREAAREQGVWIVAGAAQRSDRSAQPTNSLLVFDRQGRLAGRYDKRRCSTNDRRAFAPGREPLELDIEGVRCGFLICLDWAFPELWQEHGGRVELVFHSCVSDEARRDSNAAHTIVPLMQGYAWLHNFAISVSNSCRPSQNFPSFWVERSGHLGRQARRDESGFVVNALADDLEQDRFFEMVRRFRESVREDTDSARRSGVEPAAPWRG